MRPRCASASAAFFPRRRRRRQVPTATAGVGSLSWPPPRCVHSPMCGFSAVRTGTTRLRRRLLLLEIDARSSQSLGCHIELNTKCCDRSRRRRRRCCCCRCCCGIGSFLSSSFGPTRESEETKVGTAVQVVPPFQPFQSASLIESSRRTW